MITADTTLELVITQNELEPGTYVRAAFEYTPQDPSRPGKISGTNRRKVNAAGTVSFTEAFADLCGMDLADDFSGDPGTVRAWIHADTDPGKEPLGGLTVEVEYPPAPQ